MKKAEIAACLIAGVATVCMFWGLVILLNETIKHDAKRIRLNEDQSAAVMRGYAEIVPDEHGNPTFRWREVGDE